MHPSHVHLHSMTSPTWSRTGAVREWAGTFWSVDQAATSVSGIFLKPTTKLCSWSRAKASPVPPTKTLRPRHLATAGWKPGSSAGLLLVKPSRGSPSNADVTPSTRSAKRSPSSVGIIGELPKSMQPTGNSSGSLRAAERPPSSSMQRSWSRLLKNVMPRAIISSELPFSRRSAGIVMGTSLLRTSCRRQPKVWWACSASSSPLPRGSRGTSGPSESQMCTARTYGRWSTKQSPSVSNDEKRDPSCLANAWTPLDSAMSWTPGSRLVWQKLPKFFRADREIMGSGTPFTRSSRVWHRKADALKPVSCWKPAVAPAIERLEQAGS
mmetsp:Transcript_910/g.2546  ORF Transcript_910/g.2546 Transcript_910/m.2546 type:complete len:324 (+) Transcript_910:620-1591(+)